MDNYVEMRHSVTQVSYLLKKYVDSVLYALTCRKLISLDQLLPVLSREAYPQDEPRGWIPLYAMVTFRPDISYAAAKRRATRQNKLLAALGWVAILAPSLLVTSLVWKIGTR